MRSRRARSRVSHVQGTTRAANPFQGLVAEDDRPDTAAEGARASLLERLAKRARSWQPSIVGYHVVNNLRCCMRLNARVAAESGSTHQRFGSLEVSVHYIDTVVEDYLRYARLSRTDLLGRRVLEIGHGDNLGVALELIVLGAEHVACVDKFYASRDEAQQRAIYSALRERLPNEARRRFDRAVSLGSRIEFDPERIRCIYGIGIEQADRVLIPCDYDLIVSRAVLECVEGDAAFAAMDALLRPGGRMAHKIDLRDHGLFTAHGLHPLTFLTLPEWLYRLMTSHSGMPKRERASYYEGKLQQLGYETKIFVTHVTGRRDELIPHRPAIVRGTDYHDASLALIDQIRPRLARRFRELPLQDLLVAGIFVSARKPERAPPLRP